MGHAPGSGVITHSVCSDIYDWGRRVGLLIAGFTSRPGDPVPVQILVKFAAKANRSQLSALLNVER